MNKKHLRLAVASAFLIGLVAPCAQAGQVLFSFEGTSQLDNCALGECFRPPDTMGAVGTTQFLETSNGSVTVYNKASGAVLSRVSMATFWAAAGLPGGANGDQRVLFDHYTNRWIMNGFGDTTNKVSIAVSDTANALGAWKSTQIVGPVGTVLDYPTLSLNDKGVVIGTNNFSPAFIGTSLFVIPKADLFGGAPTIANMTTFTTPFPGGLDNGFAIQAAVNWQGSPGNTTAVIADSRDVNAQVFYTLNGVNAAGATQTAAALIAGSGYTVAGDGRQPDGTRLVDTLSPRISANAVQSNGLVYATAAVRSDLGDFAAVLWTVVNADTGALVSSGKIQSANFDYYEGSIAVNEFGEVVIGYNRSGFQTGDANGDGKEDGRISFLARTYKVDALGNLVQVGDELLLRVSDVNDYRCGAARAPLPFDSTCRQRWGDYAAVTIDPSDHHKFWAIGEYADDWAIIPGLTTTERAIWHTYIAEIGLVPEPGSLALFGLGLFGLGFLRRKHAV